MLALDMFALLVYLVLNFSLPVHPLMPIVVDSALYLPNALHIDRIGHQKLIRICRFKPNTQWQKKTISNPEIQTEKLQSILSTMAKIECLSFASLYVCHPHAACEFTFGTRLCETRTWSILRINTTIEKNTNQQHLSKFHAISSTFTENAISLFQTRSKQCKFYLNRFMSLQFQLKLDISSRFLVCRVNALGWHSQI